MESLHINLNEIQYPLINFNYDTGICEISGESYMAEPYKFYEPIFEWIQNFCKQKKPIMLNVKITYFNTSSSKLFLILLNILKKYKEDGNNIEINWYYRRDDDDMQIDIEYFSEISEIKINPLILD